MPTAQTSGGRNGSAPLQGNLRGRGTRFEDLHTDVLSLRFDVLHGLADSRAGGLVAANGLLVVLLGGGHQLLEFLESIGTGRRGRSGTGGRGSRHGEKPPYCTALG